jgi:hypothetical protein
VKTTDLSLITDKLDHIMLHRVQLAMNGDGTQNFIVVIGTDCKGSCEIQLPYDHDHCGLVYWTLTHNSICWKLEIVNTCMSALYDKKKG